MDPGAISAGNDANTARVAPTVAGMIKVVRRGPLRHGQSNEWGTVIPRAGIARLPVVEG